MVIEEFGPRVASVWNHLRTTTRNLIERAWQSKTSGSPATARSQHYDPRADQELSQLLAVLDEHAGQPATIADANEGAKARRLADACAEVLSHQTQSAEVFAHLIGRAHQRKDFGQIDVLAGLLPERLAPSELCELARANNVVVRALAQEALAQMPTSLLATLLHDPVDVIVARQALERQAGEFGSEEAQRTLRDFDDLGIETY